MLFKQQSRSVRYCILNERFSQATPKDRSRTTSPLQEWETYVFEVNCMQASAWRIGSDSASAPTFSSFHSYLVPAGFSQSEAIRFPLP